ncbi:hypothetical protein AS19_15040 [Alcanivorax sp. NBRC 101098]|nr:hypothetical protein AS19_15040 [Alcanivorax sp. NBRC 101098]
MANPHVAYKAAHMASAENVAHHAIIFAQVETVAVTGHYTSRILATMLENGQGIINPLVHIAMTDNAHNAAHGTYL